MMFDKPLALVAGANKGIGCDSRSLTRTVRRAVLERGRATPMVRQFLAPDRHLDFGQQLRHLKQSPLHPEIRIYFRLSFLAKTE
jgi:hypothetical protein